MVSQDQPLVVSCELCGASIATIRSRALYDAVDHGLDFHAAQLKATPKNVRKYFRIVDPVSGKQARIVKRIGSP